MPNLNIADDVYIGANAVTAVYLGSNKIWPTLTYTAFSEPASVDGGGGCVSASNALGVQNGAWTGNNDGGAWTHSFGFTVDTQANYDSQNQITLHVRPTPGKSSYPTLGAVEVYVDGALIASTISGATNVTSEGDITVSFNVAPRASLSISVTDDGSGGKPNTRASIQIDSLIWSGSST